jgi:hypothetical protein
VLADKLGAGARSSWSLSSSTHDLGSYSRSVRTRGRVVTSRGLRLLDTGLRPDRHGRLCARRKTEKARLDKQEENLIDLAADGGQAVAKVKMRLADIQHERARISGRLNDGVEALAVAAHLVDQALRLLDNPENLYRSLSPEQRRYMNDSIFEKIYVHDGEVADAVFKPPFDSLIRARDEIQKYSDGGASGPTEGTKKRRPDASHVGPMAAVYFDGGSNKSLLVDDTLVVVKVPHNQAAGSGLLPSDSDVCSLPRDVPGRSATMNWFCFSVPDALTGGRPVDRYELDLRDVSGSSLTLQVGLFTEVTT